MELQSIVINLQRQTGCIMHYFEIIASCNEAFAPGPVFEYTPWCHIRAALCWVTFCVAYSWSLCANMTSSIAQKVHNISQRHQTTTEPRWWVTCTKIGWRLDCSCGDMLAGRQTNTQICKDTQTLRQRTNKRKNNKQSFILSFISF